VPDEVRHQSASRLMKATSLGIGEVVFLLDFEEVNSFARAFHLCEGLTPAAADVGQKIDLVGFLHAKKSIFIKFNVDPVSALYP
jgi:AraC-like DNA-binding protein